MKPRGLYNIRVNHKRDKKRKNQTKKPYAVGLHPNLSSESCVFSGKELFWSILLILTCIRFTSSQIIQFFTLNGVALTWRRCVSEGNFHDMSFFAAYNSL